MQQTPKWIWPRFPKAAFASSILACCMISVLVGARGATIDDAFLDALAMVESGNHTMARGKAGERGAFQMKRIAWKHVNELTGWKHPFSSATNPAIAREYARRYLVHLQHLSPASRETAPLVAAWMLSPRAIHRRAFPLSVRSAAERIDNLTRSAAANVPIRHRLRDNAGKGTDKKGGAERRVP